MDNNKEASTQSNTSPKELKEEIGNQTIGYITAAFGLIAGLAWNDAVKSLIEFLFPLNQGTIMAKFIYAVFMTLILVIVSLYLKKVLKK